MLKYLVALVGTALVVATAADAYSTTRCAPTIGGGIRCTTIDGGTYTTTVCTPTIGGGSRCTTY